MPSTATFTPVAVSRVDVNEDTTGLICTICRNLIKDGKRMSGCNHHFCKNCIEKWDEMTKTSDGYTQCPNCRDRGWIINGEDRTEQKIKELKVTCKHEEFGCKKRIKMAETNKHERICKHRIIECPRGCEELMTAEGKFRHLISYCDVKIDDKIKELMCTTCAREYFEFGEAEHCDPKFMKLWFVKVDITE